MLIASAVERAKLLEPLEDEYVNVIPESLVIGGGIAGMNAALDLANRGFKVYLVEREPRLGGRVLQLNRTFQTNDYAESILTPVMQVVKTSTR